MDHAAIAAVYVVSSEATISIFINQHQTFPYENKPDQILVHLAILPIYR